MFFDQESFPSLSGKFREVTCQVTIFRTTVTETFAIFKDNNKYKHTYQIKFYVKDKESAMHVVSVWNGKDSKKYNYKFVSIGETEYNAKELFDYVYQGKHDRIMEVLKCNEIIIIS